MAKEIVKEASKSSALTLLSSLEDDAGAGLEHMNKDDFALPFLRLLTTSSAEVNEIEGARPGMFMNSVTNELYDGKTGIVVVPCAYQRVYVEWAPRGSGTGAPVMLHAATSDILSRTHRVPGDSRDYLENGHYIENTAQHYVMIVGSDGQASPALITLKSTQLKKSRKWNSMQMAVRIQGKNGFFTPPVYSQMYRLSSVRESNDKGTWYGWEIERIGTLSQDMSHIYAAAKQFAESVNKGDIQTKHETEKFDSDSPPF